MRYKLGLICFFFMFPGLSQGAGKPVLHRLGDFLSPGPLSQAHAYLETTQGCFSCHSLNQGVIDENCLSCHREIAVSLEEKEGFHGLYQKPPSCQTCHGEHQGREARIYDIQQVDHDQVDFPLEGAHQRVECKKCHQQKFRSEKSKSLLIDKKQRELFSYQGLDKACDSCHKNPHAKQFDDRFCVDCHRDSAWDKTKFDHDKDSDFPIAGKHKNLLCQACHHKSEKNPRVVPFKDIPGRCDRCHQDPHAKRLPNCKNCHQALGWNHLKEEKSVRRFNHDKAVFPLKNLHKKIACKECHPNKQYKLPGKNQCDTCHQVARKVMLGDFLNAKGERAGPDPMYRTMSCEGCHNPKDNRLTYKMVRKRCVKCHSEPFGDLWDHRVKKFGKRKHRENPIQRLKRLKKTHRFADEFPKEP